MTFGAFDVGAIAAGAAGASDAGAAAVTATLGAAATTSALTGTRHVHTSAATNASVLRVVMRPPWYHDRGCRALWCQVQQHRHATTRHGFIPEWTRPNDSAVITLRVVARLVPRVDASVDASRDGSVPGGDAGG